MTLTGNPASEAPVSPCAGPQKQAAYYCAEAERLAENARLATEELRQARRQRAELAGSSDDARLGDRRLLNEAKHGALTSYRDEFERARDGGEVMVAVANWMTEVSRLNVSARRAVRDARELAQRQRDTDALVDRLELVADAARISAAAAKQRCMDARRELAACEEAHDARLRPVAAAVGANLPTTPVPPAAYADFAAVSGAVDGMASLERAPSVAAQELPMMSGEPAVGALLRGDRRTLQVVVSRLAEEIGQDAGRLQLLMLDLRHAIIASGRRACVYDFPPRHPFWGQFNIAEGRAIAAALATLGRYFDGLDGWANGQVASPREMALAISIAGFDPRSVRRHPTPAELETLWQGTAVAASEFLFANAPDLRLDALTALLGQRADALSELWDNWGRLRPLLLGSDGLG